MPGTQPVGHSGQQFPYRDLGDLVPAEDRGKGFRGAVGVTLPVRGGRDRPGGSGMDFDPRFEIDTRVAGQTGSGGVVDHPLWSDLPTVPVDQEGMANPVHGLQGTTAELEM